MRNWRKTISPFKMLRNSKMGGPGSGRIAGGKKTSTTPPKAPPKAKAKTQKQKLVKKVVNRGYKKKGGGATETEPNPNPSYLGPLFWGETKQNVAAKEAAAKAEEKAEKEAMEPNYWLNKLKDETDINKINSQILILTTKVNTQCINALTHLANSVQPNVLTNVLPNVLTSNIDNFMMKNLTENEKNVVKKQLMVGIDKRYYDNNFDYKKSQDLYVKMNNNYEEYCAVNKNEKCKYIERKLSEAEFSLGQAKKIIIQIDKLKELKELKKSLSVSSPPVAPATVAGGKYTKQKKSSINKQLKAKTNKSTK